MHPDLFGKHPTAQQENEKSLKSLKNYVDTLISDKARPNPKDVKFYIKPRTKEEKVLIFSLNVGNCGETTFELLNQIFPVVTSRHSFVIT